MTTSPKLKLHPPAKTNLYLRIHGRRDDGFHEVETRMCPLSLADEMDIERNEKGEVRFKCSDKTMPKGEDNLVVKAVRAFERRAQLQAGVDIELTKRIPAGAGLGGGSSDAAATLTGLNQLFETHYPVQELAQLASEVGSDVPFFLYRSVCDCRGTGAAVEPVAFDWELPIVLIKPAFEVETPWAYGPWEGAEAIPGVSYAPQICYWGEMVNDLERPVFSKYLVLAQMKMWLLEQREAHAVLLSGSGSTLLVVLSTEHGGERLVEKVLTNYGESTWTYVGHTVSS